MINAALALVRRNPDPLAFIIAGVMLVAYELEIFAGPSQPRPARLHHRGRHARRVRA
jgi:hypothetical protein